MKKVENPFNCRLLRNPLSSSRVHSVSWSSRRVLAKQTAYFLAHLPP